MKKILITGAAGFIGSTLSEDLVFNKYNVVGIDNFNDIYSPEIKWRNINHLMGLNLFKMYVEDIRNLNKILNIFTCETPEIVVHIAGVTGMQESFKKIDYFYSNNISGTQNVLEACIQNNVKQIILISTASVYGNQTEPDEKANLQLLNPYIYSKKKTEDIAFFYSKFCDINVTALRLNTIYGPHQRTTMAIPNFLKKILNGEEVIVYGDGNATRDYLYIDDCINSIKLVFCNIQKNNIFNIGSGKSFSINYTIKLIGKILGINPNIKYIEHPDEVPINSKANIAKAKTELGFNPQISFEKGLENYINWYLKNSNETSSILQ